MPLLLALIKLFGCVGDADETGQMVLTTERDTRSRKILGLLKFTNYSVQVLARTQVGDGVASTSIYVQTRSDCMSTLMSHFAHLEFEGFFKHWGGLWGWL